MPTPAEGAAPLDETSPGLGPEGLEGLVDGDLRLRLPRPDDVDRVTEACRDPDVQRFTRVPSPYERHHARQWVDAALVELREGAGLSLLAVDASSDLALGAVGLGVDRAELTAELGYWVAPDARGRGVATRSCRLLCRFGFERLRLGSVWLQVAVTNTASRHVAQRLGCRLEGRRRRGVLDGPSGDTSAPRVDAEVWGLLPEELR